MVRPRLWVTVALLFVVFRTVDFQSVRDSLSGIRGGRLAALLLVHWACQMITAQRWRILARSMGILGSYRTYLPVHFVGMFFSTGLPSLVGGDAFKAYAASRQPGGSLSAGIASVLQDRATGLMILFAYGTAAILLRPLSWRGIPVAWFYVACWMAGGTALAAVWKGEQLTRRWIKPEAPSRFQRMLSHLALLHQNLASPRLCVNGALQVLLLSLVNSFLVIFIIQQICVAFGHQVNPVGVAAVVPLTDILMMIPVSVSGVGIREWAYLQALPLLGIPPGAALAVALASSTLMILRNLSGAAFLPAIPASLRCTPYTRA